MTYRELDEKIKRTTYEDDYELYVEVFKHVMKEKEFHIIDDEYHNWKVEKSN